MAIKFRNGRWYVDYFPEGRYGPRRMFPLPEGISKEEAEGLDKQIREAAVRARSGKQKIAKTSNLTVKNLFEKYLVWFQTNRSPNTYKDVESVFNNYIEPILGHYLAEEIQNDHIEIYKRLRIGAKARSRSKKDSKKKISNRTISKELAYFSSFLRWSADKGFITKRQFTIDKLKSPRPVPIVLTVEEVRRIMGAAEPLWRAFFLCLYTLGLRRNEARMLQWSDIDSETMTVRIIRKGGRVTILPLNNIALHAIDSVPKVKGSPYVFTNPKTERPIVNPTRALYRAVKKAGVRKHVHSHLFRHSIATHMLGHRIDLRSIQEYLGHTQINTTEWYTHIDVGHLAIAAGTVLEEYGEEETQDISTIED